MAVNGCNANTSISVTFRDSTSNQMKMSPNSQTTVNDGTSERRNEKIDAGNVGGSGTGSFHNVHSRKSNSSIGYPRILPNEQANLGDQTRSWVHVFPLLKLEHKFFTFDFSLLTEDQLQMAVLHIRRFWRDVPPFYHPLRRHHTLRLHLVGCHTRHGRKTSHWSKNCFIYSIDLVITTWQVDAVAVCASGTTACPLPGIYTTNWCFWTTRPWNTCISISFCEQVRRSSLTFQQCARYLESEKWNRFWWKQSANVKNETMLHSLSLSSMDCSCLVRQRWMP